MAIVRITKQFTFEMAHALTGYDGLCRNIHGHSYHLDVTVKGAPCQDKHSPKIGMLIDFGDLKKIVNEEIVLIFDHALVLNKKSNEETITLLKQNYEKVILTPYQPTTENLLGHFAEKLKKQFPAHLKLIALKLRETDSSFAEWYEEDNQE